MISEEPKKAVIRLKETKKSETVAMLSGEYCKIGNSYNISFSYDNADFLLGISDDTFTISRTGDESYTLLLEKNVEHNVEIGTKFGPINCSVVPSIMKYKLLKNGLEAIIKYKLKHPGDSLDIGMFISCTEE
ncbi:MAG: DUF1934 family protein [Clostridia bacterium]|nr:DUF1934 family protein [Clostridia bacterium]MBP5649235.1 DUF1934 family protein [Clostridia bacterium]